MAQDGSPLFLNRELSWLEFNRRVLEEAVDPTVPLLDRLRFALIVAANLDEFFMVRVAALKHAIQEGETAPDLAALCPRQQIHAASERVHAMVEILGRTLMDELLPALEPHGVRFESLSSLATQQREFLSHYFATDVQPALTPLAIDTSRPFPRLSNLSLNLAILLAPADGDASPRLAVVQIPAEVPRLVHPTGTPAGTYVLLEEIIRAELPALFPGQKIVEAAAFRIARDAEIALDDEGGRDYLEAVEHKLKKLRSSQVVRLEIEAGMGSTLLAILAERLAIEPSDVYPIRGLLDVKALQPILELPALEHLAAPPLKPLAVLTDEETHRLFSVLRDRDLLLHHPYESFDPVVAFVATAAADPAVLAIKQTLYRANGNSPIVQALIRAAESGKQVTVMVELLARFDEQSNIRWARSLEEAGAHVICGIRGYKIHAKICLVVRRGREGIERYVHLGTGNYNDRTARIYTDFSLMTADPGIGEDASAFFNALTGYSDPPRLKKLALAPTMLRERFLQLIHREQRRAQEGQVAEIQAKMNSLVDEEIIRALYQASQAGVRIRLNVRGICCLRPDIPGVSDRIEVIAVVGRFLEHARVFYFRNGGDEELYLASADWMSRNLDKRIELLFPIEAPECRKKILDALDAMFRDNVKARRLLPDGSYDRKRPAPGEEPYNAQLSLYEKCRRASAHAFASSGVRFEPVTTSAEKTPQPH